VASFVVCLLWKHLERQHNICIANLIHMVEAAAREGFSCSNGFFASRDVFGDIAKAR
jgi:hypothetical protein